MRYANEDPELLALVHRYVTPRELTILLEGGWRERKTTAWLIAVARRTEFRERLGEMLLASEVCFPPQSRELTMPIAVVGANESVKRINSNIFGGRRGG